MNDCTHRKTSSHVGIAATASRCKLHVLWVWRANEEGPDIQNVWAEWDWPHGDPEAIDSLVQEAVANAGRLSAWGYRLVDIEIDYSAIEAAFFDRPTIEGTVLP